MRTNCAAGFSRAPVYSARRGGFSLVELLTVIFIIALLIGILIPSLNAARNSAKKSSSKTMLNSLAVGLEMFKNENSSDFPQSHGYPPSFAHPPLTNFGATNDPIKGENPFSEDPQNPVTYGAQWLPMMLMGADAQGYIKRGSVPRKTPPLDPKEWYKPQADGKMIERATLYVTPDNAPMIKLKAVQGRAHSDFESNFNKLMDRPVFVDAWEQPILYYVASTTGKGTNMLSKERREDNNYTGGDQEKGTPFYFHQDNVGFTGDKVIDNTTKETNGWNFGTGARHAIAIAGDELTANQLIEEDNKETFARYIVDRKIYSNLLTLPTVDPKTPLRPVNSESYLLISPGVDGRYGTSDDVSNIPGFVNEG